jgi:hypothetical protein
MDWKGVDERFARWIVAETKDTFYRAARLALKAPLNFYKVKMIGRTLVDLLEGHYLSIHFLFISAVI